MGYKLEFPGNCPTRLFHKEHRGICVALFSSAIGITRLGNVCQSCGIFGLRTSCLSFRKGTQRLKQTLCSGIPKTLLWEDMSSLPCFLALGQSQMYF